ncbi:hypothetical protein CA13_10900 [Planctomycetes bacterium CA13]|uniref:Uncharacterized protein n=1 Tax=Novipirellula herctigrandis TaxID=2527986 RepID=A0A5C5YXC6_9BACT|nr:hypothetical protein CA13_10900 [Planctomycetes bacterium CA13]
MNRILLLLALLIFNGCDPSSPPPWSPNLDPAVAINAIRTSDYASAHLLLRDASRDLPHSVTGKPWDEIADVFKSNAERHLSRGTSRVGGSPEHVSQTSLIRTIAVGEFPFRLETQISAINQPDSIVAECDVSLDLTESLDTASYVDGTTLATGTILDDIFRTELLQQRCREYPEISHISIRIQRIPHGRQQYFTMGFETYVVFRDDVARTTSSLTFRVESRLEPATDYNGNPVSDAPFVEADTWLPPEKVGEGSGSWQPGG